MKGFVGDIEAMARKNGNFRRVLYTGRKLQLVLMSLAPGEEIGEEVHHDRDQFFRIEKGEGAIWIDGHRTALRDNVAVVVPVGARHNIRNTGERSMKLYTIYGPPEHEDGTVHITKTDAMASKEHFSGQTTE
jgi:mannose-6-phosphate isomerase-like protein (cupin superfamily)